MSKCHIAGCNYPEGECTGDCAAGVRRVRAGQPPEPEPPEPAPEGEPLMDEIGRMLAWGALAVGAAVCVGIVAGVIAVRV